MQNSFKIIYENSAYITYLKDNLYYKIAKLTYKLYENEEFIYIFEPFYDVLEVFPYLGIPGLELSLRKNQYIRENIEPVFVSMRIVPKNRANLNEELKGLCLTYYNPFLLLLDSKYSCPGDSLYLKSDSFFKELLNTNNNKSNLYDSIKHTLQKIAAKENFKYGDLEINDETRNTSLKIFINLYQGVLKYYKEKLSIKGRPKKAVSLIILQELYKQYKLGIISFSDLLRRTNISSRSTLYRRLKEIPNQ